MMKKLWIILLVTALLVSLGCHIASAWERSVDQIMLISTVKAPLRMALAEIERDISANRREIALKKLTELRLQADQFFDENGFHHGFGSILIRFREIDDESGGR